MAFLMFLRQNARWLGAGVALSFASSFGQTFFISLFSAEIRAGFGLSEGEWGRLYTLATLISAAALIQAGRLADRFTTRSLASAVILAYAAVALSMAWIGGIGAAWMLIPVIAGLRFCGQGMMSHLCITAMGRWFRAARGRAVAVAGLGFSLGEASLPLLVEGAVPILGWRGTWVAVAVFLIAVALPLLRWLMATERHPRGYAEAELSPGLEGRHWTRREAVSHWIFWVLMPGVLAPSFIGTAVFFHAVPLSELKGWDFATVARAYPLYATTTVAMSFAAGALIDRLGAVSLLPVFLLPMALGMTVLGLAEAEWAIFVAFLLLGLSQGTVTAFLGALWPELYGTRHLGAVRAIAISAMVVSTAVGPGLTGGLIDAGIAFPEQALWMAGYCVAMSGAFLLLLRRLQSGTA